MARRWQHSLSLTDKEEAKVNEWRLAGVTIAEIFRAGLKTKELDAHAKNVVEKGKEG